MKLFKRTSKEASELSPETNERTRSSGFLALTPGFIVGALGIALAAALMWALMSYGNARLQTQLIETWGQSQSQALQQALTLLKADTRSAAQDPALVAALRSKDPEAIRTIERHLSYRAGVIDAHLNGRGQAKQNSSREAPINYAALDLLRRVEFGQDAPPEAYRIGNRWVLYHAVAIRPEPNAPALGTLLIATDMQRLLGSLLPLPTETGQLRLIQQFPNAPQQTLIELGSPSDSTPLSLSTDNPHWTLSFIPGSNLASTIVSPLPLILALLICLGALAFALNIQQSRMTRRLHADAVQLNRIIQELQTGKAAKATALNLPVLDVVAKNLVRLPARSTVPQARPANSAPVDSSASTLQPSELVNPMFQDTDILDIDFLDEDSDILGISSTTTNTPTTAPKMPASIFRAYDIRGVVGDTLTPEIAYWIGRAIGSESLAKGEPKVAVARDGRLSGPALAEQLIQGLLDCGCEVSDIGMVPTPVLYFATHTLQGRSGVMLTGSHNPPDYNGFKIVIAGDTLANEQIQALRQRIERNDLASGVGSVAQVDVLDAYFAHIRDDIAMARGMKVVVDCGNGVAGVIAPRLIEALGCEVIPLYCDVDGNFPNHHPDPGKPENLADLIAKVRAEKADLGLAFDGDGDRVGVVTCNGNIVYPDRLLMLFAKDVVSRNPGADIIFDVKCTRRLTSLISGYGGRPVMWKTGHSLIKKKMKETGALLAGEMSGHIFFQERWFGFDDGIYSAARLLEILSQERRDSEQVFAAFPNDISTPELNINVTEQSKFSIIDALQRDGHWGEANLTTLDGVRVDYPKGWGLVRASNTTPVLVLRFEAESPEELARIQDVFRAQLYTVAPDLNLPF